MGAASARDSLSLSLSLPPLPLLRHMPEARSSLLAAIRRAAPDACPSDVSLRRDLHTVQRNHFSESRFVSPQRVAVMAVGTLVSLYL